MLSSIWLPFNILHICVCCSSFTLLIFASFVIYLKHLAMSQNMGVLDTYLLPMDQNANPQGNLTLVDFEDLAWCLLLLRVGPEDGIESTPFHSIIEQPMQPEASSSTHNQILSHKCAQHLGGWNRRVLILRIAGLHSKTTFQKQASKHPPFYYWAFPFLISGFHADPTVTYLSSEDMAHKRTKSAALNGIMHCYFWNYYKNLSQKRRNTVCHKVPSRGKDESENQPR